MSLCVFVNLELSWLQFNFKNLDTMAPAQQLKAIGDKVAQLNQMKG